MRVLFVTHERRVNGASKSVLNIIDEFQRRNYSIFVLTPYRDGTFYQELLKRNVNTIVSPYYVWCQAKTRFGWIKNKIMWPLVRSRINMLTARKISKFAIKEKIDIIHSNSSVINVGALISKYCNIPHIWHIREFGDLDFDMHFYESKNKIYRFMNKYTDKFICISNAVKNHYSLLDESKKIVIYNGIDIINNETTDSVTPKNTVNILIAGAIYIGKGQHEAVAACESLHKQGIDNFELYIAGDGDLYFSIDSKIAEHVHVLGHIENMAKLRSIIDIELVCSRCEAFGRVTAEAMLSGIPVIGSNTGGTPELINDGIDGFLYEKGNIEMLTNRLKYLIENKNIREKMGDVAQKKAQIMFTIKRCVNDIEMVYSEVLSKSISK